MAGICTENSLTLSVSETVGTLTICRWLEEAKTENVLRRHTQYVQADYER
jgi:hypothetical protein